MEKHSTAPPDSAGALFVARWAHLIERDGDCTVWLGPQTDGYGRVQFDGSQHRVHRVVYRLLVGPIPDDRPLLLRTCRNRACLNPTHWRPGTPGDRGRALTARRRAR